jgi:hypothetical protein
MDDDKFIISFNKNRIRDNKILYSKELIEGIYNKGLDPIKHYDYLLQNSEKIKKNKWNDYLHKLKKERKEINQSHIIRYAKLTYNKKKK